MAELLLELGNVSKTFTRSGLGMGGRKTVQALDNVSLALQDQPQVTALVGESGSGKTTLCRIVIGLEQPTAGKALYKGREISDWLRRDRKAYRKEVQVIFQDPYATYNPFYRVDRVLWSVVRTVGLYPAGSMLLTHSNHVVLAVSPNPNDLRRPFCRLLVRPDGVAVPEDAEETWDPMSEGESVLRVLRPEETTIDAQELLAA